MELFELYLSPIDETQFTAIVSQSTASGDGGDTPSALPEGGQRRITLIKTLEFSQFSADNFQDDSELDWMAAEKIITADRNAFDPDYLAQIGQILYKALFPPGSPVENLLGQAIANAESQGKPLVVRLKFPADGVQHSRLADYPWELLHDGQKFLCHHSVKFSRYIAHKGVAPKLPSVEKLNILLVSSEAFSKEIGLKRLSKQEREAIRQGAKKAEEDGHICLTELEFATLKHLRDYLTEHQGEDSPHVVHFDGHGVFGQKCRQCSTIHKTTKRQQCRNCQAQLPSPQGYLVFEDEDGDADYISAKELGTLLHQSGLSDGDSQTEGVTLVVLSACQSGMAIAGESVFNGAAQNLIAHRVPAVVAMQYSVRVDSATKFAEQFYRSLGQKNSLAVAVSQGRAAMGVEGNQWYRPVLYLRWQDNKGGQLFASATSPQSIPQNLPWTGAKNFVGRDEAMDTLHQQVQATERVAITSITGMGGIGKTELALQYAHHHFQQKTYRGGVCWLEARGVDVGIQIVNFARSELNLNPPEDYDLQTQVRYCWRNWLEGDVLVIFDDVVEYENISDFLPPAELRFKVLITTRRQLLGQSFHRLELEVLDEEAALELWVSFVGEARIQGELEEAKALCADLGFLPLGLELVARYLERKTDLSLAKARQRLGLEHKSLEQFSQDMTGERGVAAAFELSWQELGEDERELGRLLSLFAPAVIPWSLVAECLPEVDEEDLEDRRDDGLMNLSLLQRVDEGSYQLHRLIREFFRGKLSESSSVEEMKRSVCQVAVIEADKIPEALTNQIILAIEPAIPHLEEVAIN
ncbi:MAG: CHAT domain-containing protein, partial [Okeania sp. SIO1H6]|nr:CHAT domain-containing protein [Okeania sp. SIO1H6]